MGDADRKQRIVIVGGGPAGLSAAYNLTDERLHPGWQDHYEVHLYQLGWRLGGKAATGRGPNERIQEHGIHVFGNMYFNTTRMVKDAFAEVEWDDHDKYRTMQDAFIPSTREWSSEYWNGAWHGELGNFPDNDEVPWEGSVWPDMRNLVQEVLDVVSRHLGDALESRKTHQGGSWWSRLKGWILHLIGDELVRLADSVAAQVLEEAKDPHVPHRSRHIEAMKLLDKAVELLGALHRADPDDVGKRLAFIDADLVLTAVRGVIDDDLVVAGVDSIDGENYRDWLQRHGAAELTLKSAAPQALPNTSLAYEHGDTTQVPTMSAAAFITFLLRQLSGKGAGAYFFKEGTGETVIKPLYRLLEQRGVHVHFFHKLTDVVPDPTDGTITRLEFDVQATPIGDRYDPLRRIEATQELVWPDRPILDRLEQGPELAEGDEFHDDIGGYDLESWWTAWEPVGRTVLDKGDGFDHVVLATPISTLQYTCDRLRDHPVGRQAWPQMMDNLKSAATQAVQIWLDKPFTDLGWEKLEGGDRYVGALYNQDLTSFCDFSDLVAEEHWPEDNRPKALLYLIGALSDPEEIPSFDDHGFPDRQHERIKWAAIQWLRNIDGLIPEASNSPIDPRSMDFGLMSAHDPASRGRGVNQFDQQFWKANIDPNERYTLNVAGTVQYRLEAWQSGFDNLVLAGDWIYTGFNVGSFEGAIMSGKLASLALTGRPDVDHVYGYDFLHADRPPPPDPRLDHWATADSAPPPTG